MSKRKKSDLKMQKRLDEKFRDTFGEVFGDEEITRINIADADLDYIKLFGANKNLYRVIPSMQDGLKPGARRLLYSWFELNGKPTSVDRSTLNKLKFFKVNKLSSNSTGNYHPHGETSTDELIGKMGQYWSNNVMLLIPQGSYGNCRGDTPAAGRYREAKLSEFTIDCFFDDFYNYCVPMKLAYGGDSYEPEILPAKYPYILFNPQFAGIGYGAASNIPPFNLNEVLDATIKLIKDKSSKIMLIPDFPSGCEILDEGEFKKINKTGQGKVTVRAKVDIDYLQNVINITALPYNSSSNQVINSIIGLRDKEKSKDKPDSLQNIIEMTDDTVEGEVGIHIFLKKGAQPDKILDKLFKKNTGLKSTFPIGITIIDDYESHDYGIKELLLEWISYREDAVMSMMLKKLQVLLEKQHMNEVLLMVFNKDNIDDTIKIAKNSSSKKETVEKLMKRFKITSIQAGVIADMHVYNFNKDSYNKYKEEKKKLKEEIDKYMKIVESDEEIDKFIISQLEEGKKKYGRKRQSMIIKEDDSDVSDEELLVGISESGYIKKIPLKGNTNIGSVGKTNSNITVLQVNNRENILVIDSTGNVVKVSISAIPDMEYDDIGVELSKFFSINGSIKGILELPSMEVLNVKDDMFSIIFITRNGLAKRVQLNEFNTPTGRKSGIQLNDGDEVASVIITNMGDTKNDIVICTDNGNGIRLPISEIRTSSASAKGVNMISLKDDTVSSASIIDPKKKLLFYITSQGKMKITEIKYFPTMKRKDDPLKLMPLNATEKLLGIESVNKSDVVMIYKKNSDYETVNISDIKISGRNYKGDKLVSVGRGDSCIGYKIFRS